VNGYLIRLWREPPALFVPQAAGREWLIQVEHIPGGEKEYFASLDDLFVFIWAQLPGQSREPSEPVGKSTMRGDGK
jgi:hypothetical protein